MTKKIASLKNSNTIHIEECGAEISKNTNESSFFISNSSLYSNEEINEIATDLLQKLNLPAQSINLNRSNVPESLIYIPVIFLTVTDYDTDTYVDIEAEAMSNIIITNSEKESFAKENAQTLIAHLNSVFAGDNDNTLGQEDTNYGSINQNNNHLENSNVRFFLPYKLPKDQVHPFVKLQNADYNETTGLSDAQKSTIYNYQDYLNSYDEGISIGDTPEQYNSQYTYDDIKAQRELVKSIADGSRSRNTDFEIGDEYGGGYIFQINEDGTGLVAALEDLGIIEWYEAFDAASNFTAEGFEDWRLPTLEELELMYSTIGNGGSQGNIGGFDIYNFYWSSSEMEDNDLYKWGVSFSNGYVSSRNKYALQYARAIRQIRLFSSTPPEVTTLAEMEDDYFFYFGDSPGVIFIKQFEDKTGFHNNAPYYGFQLKNIAQNLNPTGNINPFNSGIYEGDWINYYFLNSIAAVRFGTTTKSFSGGQYGVAILGDAFTTSVGFRNILLKSLSYTTFNETWLQTFKNSYIHEFFHTLGFNHGWTGVTASGVIRNSQTSVVPLHQYRTDAEKNATNFQRLNRYFYKRFVPPFKYYDPNDESQILEDESTLPDFEIIDPDEKLFVEATIKTVQKIWNEIKNEPSLPYVNNGGSTSFDRFPHTNTTISHNIAEGAYSDTQGVDPRKAVQIQFGKTFGLISHLPTFWGGSYITNTPEDRETYGYNYVSLVINPTVSLTDETAVRKGPNITVYNAICDKNDNTVFNKRAFFTLEWYDDSFPPFPNNTRVEDMFSKDICPCLYQSQEFKFYSNNDNISGSPSIANIIFFTPKINEVTGEEITQTNGNPMSDPVASFALKQHYTYQPNASHGNVYYLLEDSPLGHTFCSGGNETTAFYDYIGYNPSEKIMWTTETGDKPSSSVVLPNFPIYTGFVPESNLPKVFSLDPARNTSSQFHDSNGNPQFKLETFYASYVINDKSLYNNVGTSFRSFIDKYFRIGSTNPESDLYNPFKLNTNNGGEAGFVYSKLNEFGITLAQWQNFECANNIDMVFGTSITGGKNILFEDFFKRKAPNTENPLLDSIGNTLYGPLNINTLANSMYYGGQNVTPLLPSKYMMQSFNYFVTELDRGPFKVMRDLSVDLFDVENSTVYKDYLPDNNQRNKSNTLQLYIDTAMDYVYENRIDYTDAVYGCREPEAFNYNPNAEINDKSMCIPVISGCTEVSDANYNSNANTDDGSCLGYSLVPKIILQINMCGISEACNSVDFNLFDITNSNLNSVDQKVKWILENETDNETSLEYWQFVEVVERINSYRFSGPQCNNSLASEDPNYGSLNLGGGCIGIADSSVCNFPEIYVNACDPYSVNVNFENVTNSLPENSQKVSLQEYINFYNNVSSDPTLSVGVCNNSNTI